MATRPVDLIVRFEWVTVAALAIVCYALSGFSWWRFALLILAPDLSMLGYLAGPRLGAVTYNALHILIAPLVLLLAGALLAGPLTTAVALIWIAHIAIDRALGYGLKLPTAFQDTHLGRIGRDRSGAPG
ncbi:DUF4260 domain-containing protein [Mesorhizobium sp.]|uniref:DUF4260 domain-containing protein n=1 Tax=Mesorhizobium sp. TaxID=1871066 RepID=UPI000FE2C4E9|nr:DUF4260 domain-containing protein [Mesorhizobium sp.]RWH71866.1 MAG: DUF4260 family protein [Mesorhizobium sp.]RWL32873.1 MAG: DUF4260 family protein [Mesorhizobium sp.]RWL33881.1 MAG: DUF4260 family protein [Mesorhizobium sp.]RWL39974.1 MAG: DUF4260 family protein [Mesorhizobium sp.]RWL52003.1 MAG: DUF4260 family protein [Mesorhizobium sp.]